MFRYWSDTRFKHTLHDMLYLPSCKTNSTDSLIEKVGVPSVPIAIFLVANNKTTWSCQRHVAQYLPSSFLHYKLNHPHSILIFLGKTGSVVNSRGNISCDEKEIIPKSSFFYVWQSMSITTDILVFFGPNTYHILFEVVI